MEQKPEAAAWKVWCFWICVAVVALVFVVPIHTTQAGNATFSYTLWNVISGGGPSSAEIRVGR